MVVSLEQGWMRGWVRRRAAPRAACLGDAFGLRCATGRLNKREKGRGVEELGPGRHGVASDSSQARQRLSLRSCFDGLPRNRVRLRTSGRGPSQPPGCAWRGTVLRSRCTQAARGSPARRRRQPHDSEERDDSGSLVRCTGRSRRIHRFAATPGDVARLASRAIPADRPLFASGALHFQLSPLPYDEPFMTAPIAARALRTSALAVAAFALSPGASALQIFHGTRFTHARPSQLTGDAEKVVIGQLTDDATRDVAILQGDTIVLLDA